MKYRSHRLFFKLPLTLTVMKTMQGSMTTLKLKRLLSPLYPRANRNSGGQGDGEKASVTAKPASPVTSALESFPSLEGMKRRESTKSWEIIGVSGVVSPKVKVDFKVIFPKEK